ncbi:pyridoxamine phosphate oxidase family protein [Purpureocillium lavendulum]|uniref:Pyridoxamine phosphate oxidase family protein n=1 Tax=Purpureocillium lavendulum TaxID=1247861 RepID=A0AB34FJP3_9HYPO|nr:pyridoxamine phosphate oxidase family protein [Purpureocillium lavendulum]
MLPPAADRAPVSVPEAGRIVSMVLSLAATTVLTLFLTQKSLAVRSWNHLPLVGWLVFAIYIDSYLFVFGTATLQHALGINTNHKTCDSAILLCLVCYVTTKVLVCVYP